MDYLFKQKRVLKKLFRKMITLNTDRFAVFNYAHVPWLYETMRKFDETTFPKTTKKTRDVKDTIDFFTSNGYKMVGMDHFAKPEDELFKAIEKRWIT